MPRIVLKYPFLRHYAGSVLELELDSNREYGETDEGNYDRITPEKKYFLPDGGKGYAAYLPVHDTVLCPPAVFENVNLRTGPCRLTSVTVAPGSRPIPALSLNQVLLSEDKQRIEVSLPVGLPRPLGVQVWSRTNNTLTQEQSAGPDSVVLFPVDYLPGFYELHVLRAQQLVYCITFIKCFPLVVNLNPGIGTYQVMETIY